MGRSRTYEWDDPAISAAEVGRRSGLDFMRAVQSGELPPPPIARTLDFTIEELDEGRAVFSLVAGEEHYNPIGSVHGGVYATLADSAAGCAVQTTLPAGSAYTSLDLSIRFLRPVTAETGKIRAVGTVTNRGRRTALAEVSLYDPADRLLAHATSTCLIFEIPPAA